MLPGVPDHAWRDRNQARQALGLAEIHDGKSVVGWLGRLTRVKRPDRLLEIARLMPDVLFLVGGDGPDRAALELSAPPNVRILGWTSPDLFWPACDVGLLTSDNEAIPYSLVEAQLAGVPVVASRVGGVPSSFIDGVTGLLADPMERSMARAIQGLLRDPGMSVHMGEAGRRHARATFSPRSMADRHVEIYTEALAIRAGVGPQ